MIFEGDKGVIDAIKEKKRLMDAGEPHEHIRPAVIVDGGLMKGAYGVGAGMALEELGYNQVFDSIVGISSGAPSAAYFVAGEVHKGAAMVWEECCAKDFLNVWRFWNQVRTDILINTMKETGAKSISADKVFTSRTKLFIGVANFHTGIPHLLEPKTPADLLDAIQASILMPNVTSDKVVINDIRYADGGFTKPHILALALNQIDATHWLIITNQDHLDSFVPPLPWLERLLNHTLFRLRMPKALRFAAHQRWQERMKVVKKMRAEGHVSCALVWGNRSIKSMERDPVKVKQVVAASRQWWLDLMS